MNNQIYKEKFGKYNRKIEKYINKSKTLYKKADKDLNDKKIEQYMGLKSRLVSKQLLGKKDAIDNLESFFGHFNDTQILPSKLLSNSKKVMRVVLEPFKNGNPKYKKTDIKKWGLELSNRLKKLKVKGSIQTVLNFNGMVRTGKSTSIGNDINIYNPDEFYDNEPNEFEKNLVKIDKFKEVVFFVTIENKNANFGGNSRNNDCFWFCLNNGISQYNPWEKPEQLKSFLKIKRNSLVGLEDIEKIEKKIAKVGINAFGDCNYISKLGLSKKLNLVLKMGSGTFK